MTLKSATATIVVDMSVPGSATEERVNDFFKRAMNEGLYILLQDRGGAFTDEIPEISVTTELRD